MALHQTVRCVELSQVEFMRSGLTRDVCKHRTVWWWRTEPSGGCCEGAAPLGPNRSVGALDRPAVSHRTVRWVLIRECCLAPERPVCVPDRPVGLHRTVRCVQCRLEFWLVLRRFSSAFELVLPRVFSLCVLGSVALVCYAILHV